jgi:prepilin-type N-terminal cleavage/methylation domain-containing protein/prepilin-type processing-associated H-X9-DG protein
VKKGFTLIELLVVIAIIAILAAILFPVFAKAREKARQTSCLNNVKQMALAMLQYAQDFDEKFPMTWSTCGFNGGRWYSSYNALCWRDLMHPYTKNWQVFDCPSHTTTNGTSYAMNVLLTTGANANFGGISLGAVVSPAECLMIVEAGGDYQTKPSWALNYASCRPTTRHNDGGNHGFCDGHAKWYRPDSIWNGTGSDTQKYWNPAL